MRILFVDDIKENRSLWEAILTRFGFEVLVSANGEEALEALRVQSVDMVISDILMPVMDGFQLCVEIKQDDKLRSLPFVFLTGTYTGDEDEELALRLGADRFVRKPVGANELLEIINDVGLEFQKGESGHSLPPVIQEHPDLKLYSERLVHKLEQKMAELQEEIGRRREAEKRAEDRSLFLNNVLEALTHPFYVIDVQDYSIKLANSAARQGSPEEPPTCYALAHGGSHPCTGAEHPCPMDEVRRTKKAVRVEHVHCDSRGVSRNVAIHCYPLFDERGIVKEVIEYCIDITDRKRAELALRESEERFRTLFETAHDCIFIKDRSLRYTHVNPTMEELFGMPKIQLIGKTDHELYGAWVGSQLQEMDYRVLGGESLEAEHTRAIGGIPVTFHDIRVPMRDDAGEVVGLFGISRNITERNRRRVKGLPLPDGKCRSKAMKATLAMAEVAAEKGGMILLLGESGSGKDFLARHIHDHSPWRSGPYFSVNCAALPPELAESELFGHEPGAFTGAARRKRGLLELAEGGTLLLNEIGELSLPLQAKLLTFLDTKSFTRVGGEKTVSVGARLLAATNKDLETEVRERRFRHDLYYRINVLSIRVPPLRERREDIPYLVDQLLPLLVKEMQLREPPALDPSVMDALVDYDWPGNVRELRNVLERSLMLWREGPLHLTSQELAAPRAHWSHTVHFPENHSLEAVTADVTRALVLEALRRAGGCKIKAAESLGISRFTLFRLLKSFGPNVRC